MSFNVTENSAEKMKPYTSELGYITDLDFSALICKICIESAIFTSDDNCETQERESSQNIREISNQC